MGPGLAKASIVLQYKRIFKVVHGSHCICWILLILILVWILGTLLALTVFWYVSTAYIAIGIADMNSRVPGKDPWDPAALTSQCSINLWLSHAGTSVGTDILLILLPLPVVAQMRVSKKQKIIIASMFTAGSA